MLLGILAALLAAPAAFAQSPISAKRAEAQAVFAQVQALDASLGVADERMNLANLRLAQVRHDLAVNQHELTVARKNLKRSQQMIADRLVTLYTSPQTSTLEVILGATNLDDVLARVDTANKVSSLDADVLNQVNTFRTAVKRHAVVLANARAAAKRLLAQRAAESRSVASQLGQRRALLSSINGQIAALEAAQAAQAARELQAAAAAARAQAATNQETVQSALTGSLAGAFATPQGAAVVPSSPYQGVVGVALSYLGTPYVWAGAAPGGFDCSGLVMYAYAQFGVSLPHSSYAMWGYGVQVPTDQLEPGDILFFEWLGHVGIYIGNGEFVDAPHTGDVVKVESLWGSWGASSLVGARRIV